MSVADDPRLVDESVLHPEGCRADVVDTLSRRTPAGQRSGVGASPTEASGHPRRFSDDLPEVVVLVRGRRPDGLDVVEELVDALGLPTREPRNVSPSSRMAGASARSQAFHGSEWNLSTTRTRSAR